MRQATPERVADVADEYRMALAQLATLGERQRRDWAQAAGRLRAAREAWLGLALEGEEDPYLVDPGGEA